MKSICLSCLVYTLKDKEVKDNLYLDIFYIWLAKVIQSGGLTQSDLLQVTMDSRTTEYLEQNKSVLSILIERLPCSFTIVTVNPPSNSLEGMMNKYVFTDYTQDVYIYCDIDILISRPFHTMVEHLEENTMYFCKEGPLSDANYSEGFSETAADLENMAGFSAGKFVILGKPLRDSFFKTIHTICDYSSKFYTVEQPYFNRAIYLIPRDKVALNTNLADYVAFNGNQYDKEKTIFNDMAGNVGDGKAHAINIMHALALYLIGFY